MMQGVAVDKDLRVEVSCIIMKYCYVLCSETSSLLMKESTTKEVRNGFTYVCLYVCTYAGAHMRTHTGQTGV